VAYYDRLAVLNMMLETGLVPVFYHEDVKTAIQIVAACAAGGAQVVEFTNRGDLAYEVFAGLIRHFAQKAVRPIALGVGSVIDPGTASLYISCGADFVVSPVLNPEVARTCNRRKIAHLPGCGSASEVSQAEELGVEICKIFPGSSVGGPGFVKSILAPCPWSRLMPTGGVDATEESISAWFTAGVACVGMGSKLITKELVAAADFEALTDNVRKVLGWTKEARAGQQRQES